MTLVDARRRVASALALLVAGASIRLLSPSPGDVLVIAIDDGVMSPRGRAVAEALRAASLRRGGTPFVAVVVPRDADTRFEPARKPREDLGYRETRNVEVDAGAHVVTGGGEAGKHVCGAPGPGRASR